MNERIELVSDTEVRITKKVVDHNVITIEITRSGTLWFNYTGEWDADGRDALSDVLQCHKATGSFAALADTSAVPYVGKRMCEIGTGRPLEVEVLLIESDGVVHYRHIGGGCGFINPGYIIALRPPTPKLRSLTRVEWLDQCERSFCVNQKRYTVKGVGRREIFVNEDHTVSYTLDYLAANGTWADGSGPCGTHVQPGA